MLLREGAGNEPLWEAGACRRVTENLSESGFGRPRYGGQFAQRDKALISGRQIFLWMRGQGRPGPCAWPAASSSGELWAAGARERGGCPCERPPGRPGPQCPTTWRPLRGRPAPSWFPHALESMVCWFYNLKSNLRCCGKFTAHLFS